MASFKLPSICCAFWAEVWGRVVLHSPFSELNIPTQPMLVFRVIYLSLLVIPVDATADKVTSYLAGGEAEDRQLGLSVLFRGGWRPSP